MINCFELPADLVPGVESVFSNNGKLLLLGNYELDINITCKLKQLIETFA